MDVDKDGDEDEHGDEDANENDDGFVDLVPSTPSI